jgi:type II secretory pathway pseudopilin PulG
MGQLYSSQCTSRADAFSRFTINDKKHHHSDAGFTLIEALIAGLLIVMAMSAVARFSAAAMTASQKQELRREIEEEITNNMERIQQKDSLLTWEEIEERSETQEACFQQASQDASNTSTGGLVNYLKSKLDDSNGPYYVPPPKTLGTANLRREIRAGSGSATTMTALIIYRFTTPDFNQIEEQRVLELNPNYAPRCFQL